MCLHSSELHVHNGETFQKLVKPWYTKALQPFGMFKTNTILLPFRNFITL